MYRTDVYTFWTFYSLQKVAFQLCHKLGLFLFSSNTWEAALNNCSRLFLCRAWTDTLAQILVMGSSDHFTDSDLESRSRWTNDSKKTRRLETGELIPVRTFRMVRMRDWNESLPETTRSSRVSLKIRSEMNESFKTDPSLATSARAANESGSYLCASNVTVHQRQFASLYLFSVFVVLLPNVFHTNDMFALSEKSAEKRQKPAGLPIAHYKQKTGRFRSLAVKHAVHSLEIIIACNVTSVSSVLQIHKMQYKYQLLLYIWPIIFILKACHNIGQKT